MSLSATLRDLLTRTATALRGEEVRSVAPEAGEEQGVFIGRCMAFYGAEGWASDQAAAVCHRAWADSEEQRSGRENPDDPKFIKAREAGETATTGPALGPARWFQWAMVEKGLGGVNSTAPASERFSPAFFRAVVANFKRAPRRVAIVGGEPGVPGHKSLRTLARVDDLDFDGLTFWLRVEDIIDPQTGLSRLDEAVTCGYTAPSVGIREFSEEVGGPQLWHGALLSEAEQRGTIGFPYLDEQGAGLTPEQALTLQGRSAWWQTAEAPTDLDVTGICWRSASDWRQAMSTTQTPAETAATPAPATPAAAPAATATRCDEPGLREAQPALSPAAPDMGAAFAQAMAPMAESLATIGQGIQALLAKQGEEGQRKAAEAEEEKKRAAERALLQQRAAATDVVDLMIRGGRLRPSERETMIATHAVLPAETLAALRSALTALPVPQQAQREVSLPSGRTALFERGGLMAFRTSDGAQVSDSSLADLAVIYERAGAANGGKPLERPLTNAELIAGSRALTH